MPSFPGRKRTPSKTGSTAGRRRKFAGEGSSDAGFPGTKTELRTAKHRVYSDDKKTCAKCGGKYASLDYHLLHLTSAQRQKHGAGPGYAITQHKVRGPGGRPARRINQ